MIRPLRRRHRLMTGALAVVLPVAVVAALAVRPRGEIEQEGLAVELRGARVDTEAVRLARTAVRRPDAPFLIDGLVVAVLEAKRLGDGADDPLVADVRCDELPPHPGLAVVWAPAAGAAGEALPEGAEVLGLLAPWATTSLPLPRGSVQRDGVLQLYSVGHGELVGEAVALPGEPLPLDALRALAEEDPR